jgi:hypothetical protein
LVSWRNGVSISEPTAMVSASMRVGHLPEILRCENSMWVGCSA